MERMRTCESKSQSGAVRSVCRELACDGDEKNSKVNLKLLINRIFIILW